MTGNSVEKHGKPRASLKLALLLFGLIVIPALTFLLLAELWPAIRLPWRASYYCDLCIGSLSGLILASLFIVLIIRVIRNVAAKASQPQLQSQKYFSTFSQAILVILLFVLLAISLPAPLMQAYDLAVGPTRIEGIITSTEIHTSRYGATYYIELGDKRYKARDIDWFNTLQEGQTIKFVAGPASHYAYPKQ